MQLKLVKIDGVLIGDNEPSKQYIAELGEKSTIIVDVESDKPKQRTTQQNKALHKFCQLLADELNAAGLDMKAVLKEEVEIPWTMQNVKNHLWRSIQKALLNKESTTEMDTTNPSEIHKILMKHLGEKFGVRYIDWPSWR